MNANTPSLPSHLLTESTQPSDDKVAAFPIVGIGASAGGLEAFEQFFRHIPSDSGMAFVLVPHLAPSRASLLTEILQRATTMPVAEAQDQITVEPDCVYIIPPNCDMAIFHGKLQLSLPEAPRGQRMPIDIFLRSLAEDQQDNAIGIILSGTGTDGTLGLRAIFGAGGVTLVQEPATAKYDGMPSSAIKAGYISHVLPVDKMPAAMLAGARSFSAHPEMPAGPKASSGINQILMQLRSITGHDFSLYKQGTIGRRIERRMSQHNIEDTETYARYLRENPAETKKLFKELLINVTSFFRDVKAFAALEKNFLPQLCKGKTDDDVFRVWVAGCATGEEAYSIAILVRELMDKTQQNFKVQIFSTDLDDDTITIARAGFYPPNIVQDVTPERLHRFFVKEETGYRVKKAIREMVVFAVHDVLKDPPFIRLDLLCCRNLMIYLEPELQNRLILTFHYALKPGGVLFLAPSESIGNRTELFSLSSRKWKLYRASHSITPSLPMMENIGLSAVMSRGEAQKKVGHEPKETNFAELALMLLQCFTPAAVVTDLKGGILYVHGETGKYLRPAPGQASLNVIDMAREGLELELHAAIYAAASEEKPTLNRVVQVKANGGLTTVSLSVRPLPAPDGSRTLLLMSFQDVDLPAAKPERKHVSRAAEFMHIEELKRELATLKKSNQTIIEDQQIANEELMSANEEMQSINEELQSTNEELETSQEELQSLNEELITVNSELQAKIEQLTDMQNDMKNLLDNINFGLIFLDRHLKIRSFTHEAVRLYRLIPSDVGRPLNDIKSIVESEDLLADAERVLDSLIPYEREIQINGDTWLLARILPYRTLDNLIDGVVLTFTDISSRIKSTAAQEALRLADGIVNTVREPLIVLDGTLKVISASQSFYRKFLATPEETLGYHIYELGNGQWNIPALRELLENILPSNQSFENYEVEDDFTGIGHRKIVLNARRFIGKIDQSQLILLSMEVYP